MNKKIPFIPALVLGIAMLSTSALAVAEVTVQVLNVTLIAKGAGAIATIQVTCNPSFGLGSHVQFNGQIVQRTGNSTTNSFLNLTTDDTNCNGTPQQYELVSVVNVPQKPLKRGQAILNIGGPVFINDFSLVEFGSVTQQIVIH